MKYALILPVLAAYIGCASLVSAIPVLSNTAQGSTTSERALSPAPTTPIPTISGRASPITHSPPATPNVPMPFALSHQYSPADARQDSLPENGDISSFIAKNPQNPSESDEEYVLRLIKRYFARQNRERRYTPSVLIAFVTSQPQPWGDSATAYANRMLSLYKAHIVAAHEPCSGVIADNKKPLFLEFRESEGKLDWVRILYAYFSQPPAIYTATYLGIFRYSNLAEFVDNFSSDHYDPQYVKEMIQDFAIKILNPRIEMPVTYPEKYVALDNALDTFWYIEAMLLADLPPHLEEFPEFVDSSLGARVVQEFLVLELVAKGGLLDVHDTLAPALKPGYSINAFLKFLKAAAEPSSGNIPDNAPYLAQRRGEDEETYLLRVMKTYFSEPPARYFAAYPDFFEDSNLNDFLAKLSPNRGLSATLPEHAKWVTKLFAGYLNEMIASKRRGVKQNDVSPTRP